MKNPRVIDLTGQSFGRLTVVRQDGNTRGGAAVWLCLCECGAHTRPIGTDLRKGKATRCKSCSSVGRFTTHGATGTRLYRIWKAMHNRCSNKGATGFKNYGGRGISVCAEWHKFEPFQSWALSTGYSEALSIERDDTNGNYQPSNCTWANHITQSRNRRFVAKAPDGRPWSLVARDNGITNPAYRTRLFDGWSHEQAATWPMHKRRPGHENKRDSEGRFV